MFEDEEALFRLGWLRGEQLPGIACAMLDAGFDSQPMRELAGLTSPTLRDAGELFEAALTALGRPRLTTEQARVYVRERALRRTATGVVSPIEGAREIWVAWRDLGQPPELSVFVYLEDLWIDLPEKRAEIENEIVQRAQELLSGVSDTSAS